MSCRSHGIDQEGVAASRAHGTIAVILPHFQCERFLRTAVHSVLSQSFRDIELFVVDDASSTDHWIDAIGEFRQDPRLVVLRAAQNVGHYRLKNHLIAHLGHPYIAFQDADDISHPDRLRHSLALMACTGADIVGCSFRHIDETGRPLTTKHMPLFANLSMRFGKTFASLHPSTLIKRRVFDLLGGFDGTARIAADTDFLFRTRYLCWIVNTWRVLYEKRQRLNSLTLAPETGFGSQTRNEYLRATLERERIRRREKNALRLRTLLAAPSNDIEVRLTRLECRPEDDPPRIAGS